jgi:hypothetical protein
MRYEDLEKGASVLATLVALKSLPGEARADMERMNWVEDHGNEIWQISRLVAPLDPSKPEELVCLHASLLPPLMGKSWREVIDKAMQRQSAGRAA